MSGTDSISAEAVIASKTRVKEQSREAEKLHNITVQGPTSNQELIATAARDGVPVFGVELHKPVTIITGGGPGSEIVRDSITMATKMTGRDVGKLRLYELGDEVVIWHEDGKCARRVLKSNIACILPMGSA